MNLIVSESSNRTHFKPNNEVVTGQTQLRKGQVRELSDSPRPGPVQPTGARKGHFLPQLCDKVEKHGLWSQALGFKL